MHLLGNGVCDGAAHTAAHDADLLQAFHLRGLAQRAGNVGNIVALLHGVQHFGGAAGGLHHDGDGALFPVIAGNGHGDALALLIQAEDHELTGPGVACDVGCFDLEEANRLRIVEKTLGNYFVHLTPQMVKD